MIKELGCLFRVFCAEAHKPWATYVPLIEKLLTVTTHLSTGYIPYELHYVKRPLFELDDPLTFPENPALTRSENSPRKWKHSEKCLQASELAENRLGRPSQYRRLRASSRPVCLKCYRHGNSWIFLFVLWSVSDQCPIRRQRTSIHRSVKLQSQKRSVQSHEFKKIPQARSACL